MKNCIWCRRTEYETTFNNLAHTIPETLGGKDICSNVCDGCNTFFGQHFQGSPSIDVVIKETFNISRVRLLNTETQIGKNKPLAKPSSQYFKIDYRKHKVVLQSSYNINYKKGFKKRLADN